MNCPHVKVVSLGDVASRLHALSPALADALARVVAERPKKGEAPLTLYTAAYPYGAAIVDRGHFMPPCGTTCAGCAALLAGCSYSHIPLGLVLTNSVEVFIDSPAVPGATPGPDEQTSVPLRVLNEGNLFGVFETLQGLLQEVETRPPWSVSSGARSVWVVAPLKDKRIPEILAGRRGPHFDWLRTQSHWRLVQQCMREEDWHSEVLFIGASVLDRVRAHRPGTEKLFELILSTAWRQSAALRNSATIEASLRQQYLDGPASAVASIVGDMYLCATVCHLFAISRGDAPAFEPASRAKHVLGPFVGFERELHHALKTIKRDQHNESTGGNGRSKAHYPVVLQPTHLNSPGDRGYYSFRCPSLPGLRLPRIPNFAEVAFPVKKAVDGLAKASSNAIDLARTSYFTQSGRFDLNRPGSDFQWQEFLAHVSSDGQLYERERLFVDSPFLVSGARIVRGELQP